MPNFNYTAGASFRPYTFDEMLRPLAMYTEEYNTIQEGIGELDAKAAVWDNLANQQTDKRTYERYKSYADKLSAQANALAKHGLTPSSRKALLDLKRGYTSQIIPIEQAYAARAEEAKSQYEGRAQGIVYEGDAATSSLDRYLDNPSIRYNYANSQEGFKRVATVASALAKGLRNYGNGQNLDEYTKTWLQEHGYRDTEVASAISDIRKIMNGDTNVQSNGVLRAILNDEMNTAGINTWTNRAAINDYFNRVAPALYQAVGQTQVSPYDDYGAKLQGQLALAKAKLGLNTVENGRPYRSVGTVTVDDTKRTTQMQSDIDFLKKMYQNPSMIQEKGRRYIPAQVSKVTPVITAPGRYEEVNPNLERLNNIAKRYGINLSTKVTTDDEGNVIFDPTYNGKDTYTEAMNYLEREINKSALRENSYIVDITDPTLIAKNLRENSKSVNRRTNTTGVYELDDNKKGDEVSIDDVTKYFTDDIQLEFDPRVGLVLTGTNEDGETKSFWLDPEVVTGRTTEVGGRRKNVYQKAMDDIKEAIESNNKVIMDSGVDWLMSDIYSQYNSIGKRQGLTLSSKEE